jgi:hypothetical protein
MKEITRRLYTKPVMLGMAFLVGMALVVALFVTSKSTAASGSFPVVAGNDEFETADDGQTFHDFGGSPIPAGFFGTGSLAYSGIVALKGVPLGPGSNVDTVIQRTQTVSAAGGSTPIQMTGLNLISSGPITVTYSNNTTEQWNMQVNLSDYKASTGAMTINATTFDSTLKVWPKFTFTRVGGGVEPKVLDTGAGGSGLAAAPSEDTGMSPQAVSSAFAIQPAPEPIATVAPCQAVAVNDFESQTTVSAASTSCPPITLSSTNSPWGSCSTGGGFCIPVPITEEERWARHRPGPRGTIKQVAAAE